MVLVLELGSSFDVAAVSTWPFWLMLTFCGVIFLGLEILSIIVPMIFSFAGPIAVKGKHLDEFSTLDWTFIRINKCLTVMFVYHVIVVTTSTPSIKWGWHELTLGNTVFSLLAFFVFYDFFYMWFHRILHIRSLYPYIHKHHHRQKAPSRGNLDAINVHPFEFLVGEYLHLLTFYVVPCHIATIAVFIITGGILASLNHTRLDILLPPDLYAVKWHDVHHRLPESNYAQYTMLWDKIFGSYRAYESWSAISANGKDNDKE